MCVCLSEPPEYEARDISVRVMSPKSVLISWVDPAVEMGKVAPGASRHAFPKCACNSLNVTEQLRETPKRKSNTGIKRCLLL